MPKQKHKGMTIAAIGSIPLILVLGNSMLIPILPKMKSELGDHTISNQFTHIRFFDKCSDHDTDIRLSF